MTSLIENLANIEKTAIVIDIGQAYTKYGFVGNIAPLGIIPTSVLINGKNIRVFDDNSDLLEPYHERLAELIRLIVYQFSMVNSRGRRVVIVESIMTPTHLRRLLTDIFLKQFQASSIAFISSHLAATYTLGRCTALVLDIGYKEAQVMPIAESVPMVIQFDSVSYAGEAIHKQIQLLLEQYGTITYRGEKKTRTFSSTKMQLTEEVLEDIKVRCCFISPFARAQTYAKNKLIINASKDSFKEAASINYTIDGDIMLHIPGIVREFACEVLFEQDIDGRSVPTLILDTLIRSPIDLRRQLAENIFVIGGTAMIPGFLQRFNDELHHLVNVSTYANRLAIKTFKFHSPPAQLNYTTWLGGSLFGALDSLEKQSILREKYLVNGILPDWFSNTK